MNFATGGIVPYTHKQVCHVRKLYSADLAKQP